MVMNTLMLAQAFSLIGLLQWFLIAIVIIAVIAGLIWAIERWISAIPTEVKLVIAIILVIVVIIIALKQFGGM